MIIILYIIFSNLDIYYIINMVNDMRKLNRNGFTLIELIGVIVLLAIIMGVGLYSIVPILRDTDDKEYELLVENINSSLEEYYMECKYGDADTGMECDNFFDENIGVSLGNLVKYGFLKGNATTTTGGLGLINPKTEKSIYNCKVYIEYEDKQLKVYTIDNPIDYPNDYKTRCPNECDYDPDRDSCL